MTVMRKAIFSLFIAMGACAGLLSSLDGGWGLRIVMTTLGAVAGIAIGGGVTRMGKGTRTESRAIPGLGTDSEDLAANYWRDGGHPPFMKPRRGEHGRHMLDPENLAD